MGGQKRTAKKQMIERKDYLYRRVRLQEYVASSIRQKENAANYQPNDLNKFHLGEDWFNNSMRLEDAPEELRNNYNFINGFNRAKRLKDIAEFQYNLGVQYAISGVSLDQIPEKHRNNPNVIMGYEGYTKESKSR